MKTLSLSIVPETVGCNAKCKMCISRSTFATVNEKVDYETLDRACRYAKDCGAQTAIITSKGETLLTDTEHMRKCLSIVGDHFAQIDLHTNGTLLSPETWAETGLYHLTNITISIAHYDPKKNAELMGIDIDYDKLFGFLKPINIHKRLSCVMAKGFIDSPEEIEKYLTFARHHGINAVVFRDLWVTDHDTPEAKWCNEHSLNRGHRDPSAIDPFNTWYWSKDRTTRDDELHVIHKLPWSEVYEWKGVQITVAECDYNREDFVKSLILLPDNHVYSTWNSKASMIW